MSQFKRELARERKSYSPNARKLQRDSTQDELHKGNVFSKTTTKRNVGRPHEGIKALPKIGDDLEGQLNNDTRNDRNIVNDGILKGKANPLIPRDQRRNWENNKRVVDKDYENVVNETDTYDRKNHSSSPRAKDV